MDDASVGKHCQQEGCHQKEYYAFECRECQKFFCGDHRHTVCPDAPTQEQATGSSAARQSAPRTQCNASATCEEDAIAHCNGCNKRYCLQHRFQDQHACPALQQEIALEQKAQQNRTDQMQKLKEKSAAQQAYRQAVQQAATVVVTPAQGGELTEAQKKKYLMQQRVQRIKARSGAKGDANVPRDQRFAFTITFDADLANESASVDTKKPLVQFYDKRQTVGQMVDQLCRQLLFTVCIDFDQVERSQVWVYAPQVNQTLQLFEPGAKIGSLTQTYPWFEPGDTIVIRRGKLV